MVSNNKKNLSKAALSRRIKAGRAKAKSAKKRGPPMSVVKRARKQNVPKGAIYYKAGEWHVPSRIRDLSPKAQKKLPGKKYNWFNKNEWRGDHNRSKRTSIGKKKGWL